MIWKLRARLLVVAIVTLFALGGSLAATTAGSASPAPDAVARIQQAWSSVPDYLSSSALAQGQVVSLHGAAVPGATVLLFPVTFAVKPGTVMTPLSRAPGGRRKAHPALRTSTQSAHDLQPPCICGRCLRKAAKPLVDNVGRGGRPWGGAAG